MAKNSSVNLDITNNADGYDISGGTTKRKLTVSGADVEIAGTGTAVITFPSVDSTLISDSSTNTLTNKTIDVNGTGNSISNIDVADHSATGTPSATTYYRGDNTWSTPSGSGDVTKVGTPLDNQIGIWTGDGTIEGDTSLTYDGTTLTLASDDIRVGQYIYHNGDTSDYLQMTAGNISLNLNSSQVFLAQDNGVTVNGVQTINNSTTSNGFELNQTGNGFSFEVNNSGTEHGAIINQTEVLNAARYGLYVQSNAIQVNAPLVYFNQDNASSTENTLTIKNDGSGKAIEILAGNLDVTGDIIVTGTVDGIDIATDVAANTAKTGVTTEISSLIEDTTPELGGELDCGLHTIGFTAQTATGDGATTIDWKLGNKMHFTAGAFDETFTFTNPTNPCNLTIKIKQDATGSRDMTFPATVKWLGTEPTWSDGGASKTIIMSMYFDGTDYWSAGTSWEA